MLDKLPHSVMFMHTHAKVLVTGTLVRPKYEITPFDEKKNNQTFKSANFEMLVTKHNNIIYYFCSVNNPSIREKNKIKQKIEINKNV